MTKDKSSFRADIQALRGLAVLLVVVYHSKLGIVQSGFLGVDIFFVISGFLITGIIRRGIVEKSFSMRSFYAHRARRILPATFVMLAVTTVAAALLTSSTYYREYLFQLTGSVFFGANITLWKKVGYFFGDADYSPLLHMWSLAVEEQYYFCMPVFLLLVPRRFWWPALLGVVLLSFAGAIVIGVGHPSVSFYLLPTRAWELGIGSVGAFLADSRHVAKRAHGLRWPAMLLLAAIPLLPIVNPHPGLSALGVCLGTLLVILARVPAAQRNPVVACLAWVGNISFSLYLLHWPIYALLRVVYVSPDLPVWLSLAVIPLAVGLSMAMYRWIEEPIRRSSINGARLVALVVVPYGALLALAFSMARLKPDPTPALHALAPVAGLRSTGCFTETAQPFDGTCTQSPTPTVLLWGDSFSAHLVPGLLQDLREPLAQASASGCTPFVGYTSVKQKTERALSENCVRFADGVMDYLRKTPSVRTVVISGNYVQALPGHGAYGIRRLPDGTISKEPLSLAATLAAEKSTVALIRSLGRKVVLVSPTPPSTFNMGQCWERTHEKLPILGSHRDCLIARDDTAPGWVEYHDLVDGFERVADVPVVRLDRALCDTRACQTQANGLPLFLDGAHLTTSGSLFVGRRLRLGQTVLAVAR